MNAKKKNKNKQNKPPNLNPAQKLEVSDVEKEKTNTIEEKPKSDERVPEIVSEVVNPAAEEAKASETDTPKKPKRNRGKKKKSDKDFDDKNESEDNQEQIQEQPIIQETIVTSEIMEEIKEKLPEEKVDEPLITPSARKKKNKKKHIEQSTEDQKQTNQEIITTFDESERVDENVMSDMKIVTLVPVVTEPGEQENKAAKKKNKKKKRTDSERSDKGEEISAVTAAFQKILEPRDDKKDTKKGIKEITEPIITEANVTEGPTKDVSVNICVFENKTETEPLTKSEQTPQLNKEKLLETTKDIIKEDSGKGKKKNKKDKNHPLKEEQDKEVTSIAPETQSEFIKTEDTMKSDNLKEIISITGTDVENKIQKDVQPKMHIQEQVNIIDDTPIETEKSPKQKAKIAKPVEKKQKAKTDIQNIETFSENLIGLESIVTKEKEKKEVEPENGIKQKDSSTEIYTIKHEESDQTQIIKNVQVPENTDKKRKKAPKPTKKDAVVKEQDFSDELITKSFGEKTEFTPDLFPDPTCVIPKVVELPTEKKTEETVKMTKITEEIQQDQQSKILENIPLSYEATSPVGVSEPLKFESEIPGSNTEEDKNAKMPECEQLSVPEASTRKKRKKSPKPTKKDAAVKEQDFQKMEELIPKPHAAKTDLKPDLFPDPTCEIVPKVEELPTGSKTEEPITITKVTEVIQQDQQSKILENIPLSYDTASLVGAVGVTEPLTFETEIPESNTERDKNSELPECEQLSIPETSSRKKRKKSPKLPKQFDVKTETKEPSKTECKPLQSVQPFQEPAEKTEDSKEKAEVLPEIPLYGDIEIRSIKAEESEGSSSDIFPDIHYPRSISQLVDNNNNMFIREITATDVKLNIPGNFPDTPFIQGSGETPSPDVISTGIKITEMGPKTSKPSDEKTDLKSKVIEVNKDMEDLRKSIEKSLAELTAMETGEKKTEQQFVEAQAKIEKIKEIASQHNIEGSKEKILESPVDKIEQPKFETSSESTSAEVKLEAEVLQSVKEFSPSDTTTPVPPPVPSRRDNKGKGKSKKKGKHETEHSTASGVAAMTTATADSNTSKSTVSETKDAKQEEKTDQKTEEAKEKGKQQTTLSSEDHNTSQDTTSDNTNRKNFEPIENFEDAMTSSLDDINKSFEMIANDANENIAATQYHPEINITAPIEDDEKKDGQEKVNPVSQPKNLLGHPDIPVRLNKTDYKKEKNKTPNLRQAKVKIKDAVPIEVNKQSKESQTENKQRFIKDKTANETICSMTNENEEYVYKYSFRKVFLPSACHICKKDLKQTRVPCSFCNLVFYCNQKHKDEDYAQHQAFCFAVSTIVHLKAQKHIYSDAKSITGQDYRLLRMQMIVSCEKVLKRKLVPCEQEALLYPRVCADAGCREWRQGKLKDCEGCGQVAYCSDNPDHLPSAHQRWCKSYCLYQRLVVHQQTRGRLELKMPTRIMEDNYQIPEKMNEVLASMFEEKIDMSDIQYAALTQVATAPLTAAFCHQLYTNKINATYANGVHQKSSFTVHVVGAELQFEADALNKWEVFFLHLRPDLQDLRVVLIGPDLNPSKLPLDLLAKIKLCENCRQRKRRVIFDFQDGKTYNEYWSTDFSTPDLVCAFNPSIERSSIYNGKDSWPATIRSILKQKVPFLITSYTVSELQRDLARIRKCADDEVDLNIISEPKLNVFSSLRPDRNFISDDEMPLLFKNYCYTVVCGGF